MAVAVGPRGIEKIAAEVDGTLEGGEGFGVFGARPASHAPHAVTDFADLPSGAAETAEFHSAKILPMRIACVILYGSGAAGRQKVVV